MIQHSINHSIFSRLGLALVCALMLCVASGAAMAQSVSGLRFTTDGAGTSSYGNATSSDGALRGNVQFKFNGGISNGVLSIGDIEVKLPTTPSGTRFYRIKDQGYYGVYNRASGNYPVVTYSTSDPNFNVLTISNLGGSEYFSNTSARWIGKMTVTLKFSKVSGVADQFRIRFTPERTSGSPPPAVSGTIASGRMSAGSGIDLIR